MVKKLDAIKIYEIAESGNTDQNACCNVSSDFVKALILKTMR